MGNSNSSVENDYLEQIKKIDEDEKTRTDVFTHQERKKSWWEEWRNWKRRNKTKLIYQLPKTTTL